MSDAILIIGATGFVGSHLARALLTAGHAVRGLVRSPTHAQDLAAAGCEIVPGDMLDLDSLEHALQGMRAVYVTVQTVSRRQPLAGEADFMAAEMAGLHNIVTACQTQGVHRLIYLSIVGSAPDATSVWMRGRWEAEEYLLHSGLDVTVLRPVQVVGIGGGGFDLYVRLAREPVAIVPGTGQQKMNCTIALDDLLYYLVGVLAEPRTFGQRYDVGDDEWLTSDRMIDIVAEVQGHTHPHKFHLSLDLVVHTASFIEHVAGLPKGAVAAVAQSMDTTLLGNPTPIRAVLPRPPLSYREAVQQALRAK